MNSSRAYALGLLLLMPLPAGAAKASPDEAYQAARTAYRALKADAARRKFRHHWLNVAKKFEQVAARYPKSPRAPEALFSSGELLGELSRFSAQYADLEAAMADYQKLVDGYPKHALADDASLALARIEVDRQDDVPAARALLERGLAANPKADRAKEMRALLASLPAAPARKPVAAAAAPTPKAAEPAEPPKAALAVKQAARDRASALASAIASAAVRVKANPDSGPAQAAKLAEGTDDGPGEADEPEVPAPRAPMPALERVQERLRSVRVGDSRDEPARKVDPKLAKARLRQVAKDEKGAEVTLAEQLGLKVRRVVIDAGHGGHDSGAVGGKGTLEKDVTLQVATKLAEKLSEAGLEVLLTRDDDTFVRLEDRAKIANEAHGDLFISVHCNSATSNRLRGIETYTLNTSSDRYSIRLAARENASSEKGISDLQFILADLATKANTEESSRLALKVQRGLVGSLKLKHKDVRDLGNKEALFYVLLGTKMPAILVETSFLSNPAEEQLLASPEYQDELADAIAAGVRDFVGDRQRLAKVD